MSLVLSAGLTLSLFQRLDVSNAQQELDLNVIRYKQLVESAQCQPQIGCVSSVPGLLGILDSTAAVNQLGLGADRLLLLEGPAFGNTTIIYDSAGPGSVGSSIPIQGAALNVSGSRVYQGRISFSGSQFMLAASYVGAQRSAAALAPFSGWVVLARPLDAVQADATRQLLPLILEAAGAGLVLAVLAAMLISRAIARPLGDLKSAAQDIAGGNYGRRVEVGGGTEIQVVGEAFNEMATAVEAARETQRQFLADVSHELKTPLTSLIGFSQALVDGSRLTDQEQHRAATILHEEAERVLRMSQGLLDLVRVESGQLTIDRQSVDVAIQMQQEVDLVRQRAQARHLTLELASSPRVPPVSADPERLHQILENLLDNAVKYAPEGSTISVGAAPRGTVVDMTVRNRIGANPPDPHRMFDRFYRADRSRSSAAGGVGLGLAISKQLALAQGGDLEAVIDAEGGLLMTLTVPIATGETAAADSPDPGLSAEAPNQ